MTDSTIADNAVAVRAQDTAVPRPTSPTRPARPRGVPRWIWAFGVAVLPLGGRSGRDSDAQQGWVVSAGAGTSHFAVLFFDERPID